MEMENEKKVQRSGRDAWRNEGGSMRRGQPNKERRPNIRDWSNDRSAYDRGPELVGICPLGSNLNILRR